MTLAPEDCAYLVRATARRLPAAAAERYEEEWEADLHELRDRPLSARLKAAPIRWHTESMIRSLERNEAEATTEVQIATAIPEIAILDLDLCLRMRAMCAANQLRRTTRGITQLYEAEMAASGVKPTQLPILVGLRSEGDLSVRRRAGALSLDRTTLTRNLGVLEKRGLIRMSEDLDDARVRIVSITSDGEQVLSGALARWEGVQDLVEERFGPQRLRALYDELTALEDAIGA